MSTIYFLVAINNLCLLLASVAALLLTVSFSRTQRARFPFLRRLDGRQLQLTVISLVLLVSGYATYFLKEIALARLSFEVTPGPGTSRSITATLTGIDLELRDAAAERVDLARSEFRLGKLAFDVGRYAEAAQHYRASLQAIQTLSCTLNLALALRYLPDYPAAEPVLRQGLELSRRKHDDLFEAHFSLYLSSVLGNMGSKAESKAFAESARDIYDRVGYPVGAAYARLNLGNRHYDRGDFNAAVAKWHEARDGFLAAHDDIGSAHVEHMLGAFYMAQWQFPEAARRARTAIQLYQRSKNLNGVARSTGLLAAISLSIGRPAEALASARKEADIARQQGDRELEAHGLCMQGFALDEQGQFREAIDTHQRALNMAESAKVAHEQLLALIGLASATFGLGDITSARQFTDTATTVLERSHQDLALPTLLNLSGRIHLSVGRLDNAHSDFQQSYHLSIESRVVETTELARVGLAMVAFERGRHDEAREWLTPTLAKIRAAGLASREAREAFALAAKLETPQTSARQATMP